MIKKLRFAHLATTRFKVTIDLLSAIIEMIATANLFFILMSRTSSAGKIGGIPLLDKTFQQVQFQ